MSSENSILYPLVFFNVVMVSFFFMVLGSKWILSSCEVDKEGECITVTSASELAAQIAQLNMEVATARELAASECSEVAISPNDWNLGNTSVLEGCWVLQYEWAMQYRNSGVSNKLLNWDFCLAEGQTSASQNLYFEDNLQCFDQPLSYSFVRNQDETKLNLMDVEDLSCTMDGILAAKVIARELICTLVPRENYADCKVRNRIDQSWASGVVLRRRP
jgi:hypothetical protein